MKEIDEQQYIGLLNEIATFNNDYHRQFNNPKKHASKAYCSTTCQFLSQKLLDLVQPFFPEGKAKAKKALIKTVGIIIGNQKYQRQELFIDLTKEQANNIIKVIENLFVENKMEGGQQEAHLKSQLGNLICDLEEQFGLSAK